MRNQLTFIDLFAGVGGFRRGMELAGHKCLGFCEWDKYAARSYLAMHCMNEEEYVHVKTLNQKQAAKYVDTVVKNRVMKEEWLRGDINEVQAGEIPKSDVWCFGFPCQDISVAGKQQGFEGSRSSLFFRVMELIEGTTESDKPSYLFIENVKNLLSINGGKDFLRLLIKLDELGYDAEWQVLNSKDFGVPQNRERVFIIGHLRGRCTKKIFSVQGSVRKNNVTKIKQVGKLIDGGIDNPNRYRVYDPSGICACLTSQQGGGLVPSTVIKLPSFCDMSYGAGLDLREDYSALLSRYHKGISNRRREVTGICIPVLTPDRINKRQNGRRFKENGDPSFTLTGQDKHGVLVKGCNADNFIWSDKYKCYVAIRRLTPLECFRLQGWYDKYFERAKSVNSDSQLYKQAGNGVTVNVIQAIAEKMGLEVDE